MRARAFLGNGTEHHTFLFNPQSVEWGYRQIIHVDDTLGGRVMQLLSVNIQDMTMVGQAGSRKELIQIRQDVRSIMEWQSTHQEAVNLKVPSRGWHFKVYPMHLPRAGWDLETVDYTWQLVFAVADDLGVKTQQIVDASLQRLALENLSRGIGFDPKFHGGDAGLLKSIITKVMGTLPSTPQGPGGFGTGVPDGPTTGTGPVVIAQALKAVGCPMDKAVDMTAIAGRESSWVPTTHTYGFSSICQGPADCGKPYTLSDGRPAVCEDSWGCWQINWCAHQQTLTQAGVTEADLKTPVGNAQAAKIISGNFSDIQGPWHGTDRVTPDQFAKARAAVKQVYR
jgi:hypothetical protein